MLEDGQLTFRSEERRGGKATIIPRNMKKRQKNGEKKDRSFQN